MKNIFNLWLLLLAMAFVAACSRGGEDIEEPDVLPTPSQPTITLGTTASDFTTDGGSHTISFTASTDWTAEVINSRADAWCSVSPTSGKAGDAEITVTTQPNDTPDDRSASVIIKAGTIQKTINVSQKQKDALTVTSSKFEVEAEGGEVKIEVKANIDFEYSIAYEGKDKDWISSGGARALKTSTLTFKVAANEETDKREATVTIKSGSLKEEVKVYQAGAKPSITLTKNEFVIPSAGETIAVEVKSNVNVEVELPAEATWISENKSRTMSTNTYYFIINESQEYDQREALIKFTNKDNGLSETVRVVQVQKDAIVVAKDSYTVDNNGDEITIEVGHNVDFDIEIGADWISRKQSTSRGFVTENLTFVVAKHDGYDNRESSIKFISKDKSITQTVKVYQAQEDALVISKKDIMVSDVGGDIDFEIQSNIDYTVINPNVDWLHSIESRALSIRTLRYRVDANNTYDSREALIIVTNEANQKKDTITIAQAQKDAIVLAKNEYEFGVEGGTLDFEIQTNVDVTVSIPDSVKWWVTQIQSRALDTKTLHFDIAACNTNDDRSGAIIISGGNANQTITIKQNGMKAILEAEREALIAFYKATGGDNWIRNDNWCSDKPLDEWYGVSTLWGRVYQLNLNDNNLVGAITNELEPLSELIGIWFTNNKLTGLNANCNIKLNWINCVNNCIKSIHVQNCTDLKELLCFNNDLTTLDVSKNIELEILDCSNNSIAQLDISNNLNLKELRCSGNDLTTLDFSKNTELEILDCSNNSIAQIDVSNNPNLKMFRCYNNSISQLDVSNNLNLMELRCGDNNLTTLDVSKNIELEILDCDKSSISQLDVSNCEHLKDLLCHFNNISSLNLSHNSELQLLWCHQNNLSELDVTNLPKLQTLWCGNYMSTEGNHLTSLDLSNNAELKEFSCFGMRLTSLDVSNCSKLETLECSCNPITSLDISKNTMLKELWTNTANLTELDLSSNPILEYLNAIYNPNLSKIYITPEQNFEYVIDSHTQFVYANSEFADYESTDYSQDGIVAVLQTASKGNGIDIVLMGDGYSDRLVTDGTYDKVMKTAMEKFFSVEPYKSYRELFNVYSVKAVSKNEEYNIVSETAFSGYFGDATLVGGNDQDVFNYALRAIGDERMNEALMIVMMNSTNYAGTCYMYYPSNGDYGNGPSIAYFPVGTDDTALEQILQHEANGHGFAKLADEYAYEENGMVSTDYATQIKEQQNTWGWWKNVDFTNDLGTIRWSKFINDSRYANEGLGVYEGGLTYWSGVWRPTENSIMRYNTGGFNAPSREAIYYRIHKLAYGSDWQYDYEKFVEYDAINRSATVSRSSNYVEVLKDYKPLHAPVVVKGSWKNAKNNALKKVENRNAFVENLRKSSKALHKVSANPTISISNVYMTPDGKLCQETKIDDRNTYHKNKELWKTKTDIKRE